METKVEDPIKDLDKESQILFKQLTSDEQRLIVKLVHVHGPLSVKRRDGRYLFVNMACPECLKLSRKEFFSMHMGIDIGLKYIEQQDPMCARCNKQQKGFSIEDLLTMPTLEQRGIRRPLSRLHIVEADAGLVQDDYGNKVPKPPGETLPISLLPDNHHAVMYLKDRGYSNMVQLHQQFGTSYCHEELEGQYYGREKHGFTKTPKGRLVFFLSENGVSRGWQARIIEKSTDTAKYYYHPHTGEWFKYAEKKDGIWVKLYENFKLSKYVIGVGTRSTQTLMGFDAAVKHPGDSIIITEGVLDAAKVGMPAISVQGKSMSDKQVRMITNQFNESGDRKFKRVCVVADNDEPGQMLKERVMAAFQTIGGAEVEALSPPDQYNDLGDMPEDEAKELVKDYL